MLSSLLGIKATISSDKCSVLNRPTALLDFCVKRPEGDSQPREHVQIELTRDQLASLVQQFDTIQATVQELKS